MHRIRLANTVFEGANTATLVSTDPAVLVDTGVATDPARTALEEGLAEAGVTVGDLDAIVLTHSHPDHVGLAGEFAARSDATVYAHPDEAALIRGGPEAWDDYVEREYALFDEWGVPEAARTELEPYIGNPTQLLGDPPAVEPITHGDRVPAGETDLQAVHTPGHAKGHLAYEVHDGREILTGDALLPEYTPNVGGADLRVERPLAQYVDTLERLAAADYERAWPGHREVIDDPTERAEEILDHHAERAYRVLSVLEETGPADAWTVSAALFGDLERIHIIHGPGEAYAHLDHLTRAGEIEREGRQYRLTPDTRERLATHEGTRWPL